MLVILNSSNAHTFPFFQLIMVILVSKFMIHRALFDIMYLSLGLLSPSNKSEMLGNYLQMTLADIFRGIFLSVL